MNQLIQKVTVPVPVSYTHLDVYKRQGYDRYQLATYRIRLDPVAVGGLRNRCV